MLPGTLKTQVQLRYKIEGHATEILLSLPSIIFVKKEIFIQREWLLLKTKVSYNKNSYHVFQKPFICQTLC